MLVIDPSPHRPISRDNWLEKHGVWLVVVAATIASLSYYWWLRSTPPTLRLQPIANQSVDVGQPLTIQLVSVWSSQDAIPLEYGIISGPEAATIDSGKGIWKWTPDATSAGRTVRVKLAVRGVEKRTPQATCEFSVAIGKVIPQPVTKQSVESDDTLHLSDSESLETPSFVSPAETIPAVSSIKLAPNIKPVVAGSPRAEGGNLELIEGLAKLYRAGMLCDPAQYPNLRRLVAARFEQQHAAELKAAFQGSGGELERWLGQHTALRDELYLAFEPGDDIVAALKIIERLHLRSFQRLTANFELAIATAVTWDREAGVYDYSVHQRRSHATVSREKPCDGVMNFEYYSDPEFAGRARIRKLPWEFLKHVVNHRTPLEERAWVQRTYHDPRRPIGQSYEDVAYDHQMIKSGESTSNLAPRPYTLANLKDRGGICVMQADYATRVAKCLGIPAAYVEGRARTGGNHAWVMWTGLQGATSAGLAFSLESHGRFFLDRYYVGELLEPQTGRMITDRELELRLQGVGLNPLAYRHAELILQAWPALRSHLQLTVEQELDVLEAVIDLSPGNQTVWRAVAQLAKSGRVTVELNPRLDGLRDRCLKTFANCPDFVCQIIDDLLAYEPDLSRRLPTYDKLLQLWASTARPDLTCQLRWQLTDQLTADKQYLAALGGLAQTIKRFPDEGRQIPRLLDKYEQVAQHVEDGQAKTLKLYQELMPLIPRRRQSQTSPFYLEMLARAAQRFRQAGDLKPAAAYAEQLQKLQAK